MKGLSVRLLGPDPRPCLVGHDRMRNQSFACPYCGLEERHTDENNWDPTDEQLDEWGM